MRFIGRSCLHAFLLPLTFIAIVSADHLFNIKNKCLKDVWVGILAGTSIALPENGGFHLASGSFKDGLVFADKFSGRIWGRTGCQPDGTQCETGGCGGTGVQCAGTGGETPATLAEFSLDAFLNQDVYDISLVDGFNLPMSMTPNPGTFEERGHEDGKECSISSCAADVNAACPEELEVRSADGSKVVACKSSCTATLKPEFCCTGEFDSGPEACPPLGSASLFNHLCPDAYSYAYDDATSTYTCGAVGSSISSPSTEAVGTSYTVTFCP